MAQGDFRGSSEARAVLVLHGGKMEDYSLHMGHASGSGGVRKKKHPIGFGIAAKPVARRVNVEKPKARRVQQQRAAAPKSSPVKKRVAVRKLQ